MEDTENAQNTNSSETESNNVSSSTELTDEALRREQDLLDQKIEQFNKSDGSVKAGLSGGMIDYSKYVGMRVEVDKVVVGTKPSYFDKEGKKHSSPVGVNPCFIVTTKPVDKIDLGDGNFKDITFEARLNAFFVDGDDGKQILSFTKDDKGMAWKFCRRQKIENPLEAVGSFVEIEQQINKDPNDDRVFCQIRI